MSKKRLIDRLEIPNPCLADWERMVGTQQIRFCEECNKHVYNLSGMTRGEAEVLISSAPKGSLCARLMRDADGITVTREDQPGEQLLWRRASPIANAVVSAILTMATPAVASAGQVANQNSSSTSFVESVEAKPDWQGPATMLSGTVADPTGAAIEGALLALLNEDTGDTQLVASSSDGAFRLFVPAGGLFTLNVHGPGLVDVETNGLALRDGHDRRLNITVKRSSMQFETVGGGMGVPTRTLMDLYELSDRIVVARTGKSVKVRSAGGQVSLVRTSLMVSSTLKGEAESIVNVYRFKQEGGEDPFPSDQTLLVFLRHRATIGDKGTDGGYEVADYSRAVKALPGPDLDSYLRRINELAQVFPESRSHQEEIVEWLVRCAEDPATRWEGAAELASSATSLRASCRPDDPEEVTDSSEDTEDESAESVEAVAAEQPEIEANELYEGAAYAALLTADQKERLMKTLLSTETITEANVSLVEAVQDFRDPRLLPFLISQLRRAQDDPPEFTMNVMWVVAELLHDRLSKAHAESYDEIRNGDDEEEVKDESEKARVKGAQLRLFLRRVDQLVGTRIPKSSKR